MKELEFCNCNILNQFDYLHYSNPRKRYLRELGLKPINPNEEKPGIALVLRYASCNLRCPLCYAWRYAWTQPPINKKYNLKNVLSLLDKIPESINGKIVWIRIQGGEPCLYFCRTIFSIIFAIKSLNTIHAKKLNHYSTTRAIIQTNGIGFSKLKNNETTCLTDLLAELLKNLEHGRLIFEVSFKYPHPPKNNTISKIYNDVHFRKQIQGYKVLIHIAKKLWKQDIHNIAVYPVAGLGPSIDLNNAYIIPIDPDFSDGAETNEEYPLFHPKTWSTEFIEIRNEFINKIVPKYPTYKTFKSSQHTGNGTKLPLEELEASSFQKSWISGYAGKYLEMGVSNEVVPISLILRKLTEAEPTDDKWMVWFKEWTKSEYFGRGIWEDVLHSIPSSSNPYRLIQRVEEMKEYFYPAHPKKHYPYL